MLSMACHMATLIQVNVMPTQYSSWDPPSSHSGLPFLSNHCIINIPLMRAVNSLERLHLGILGWHELHLFTHTAVLWYGAMLKLISSKWATLMSPCTDTHEKRLWFSLLNGVQKHLPNEIWSLNGELRLKASFNWKSCSNLYQCF